LANHLNHCVFADAITDHRYKTGKRNAKIAILVVVVVESTSIDFNTRLVTCRRCVSLGILSLRPMHI